MFSSIFKLIRTIGYLLTGRIDKVSETWSSRPEVIAAKYDSVVQERRERLNQYKTAVAGLISSEEGKKQKLKILTEEANRLEKLRQAALGKAKEIANANGNSIELLKTNHDYLKCQSAYQDFSSTLNEKNSRIAELEEEITVISQSIVNHKTDMEKLLRDLDRLKDEKHETLADVAAAGERKKIADLLSGIGEDKTSKELAELREMRSKARADARISNELANIDAKRSEEEFLAYASSHEVDDEFTRLLGLTKDNQVDNNQFEQRVSE